MNKIQKLSCKLYNYVQLIHYATIGYANTHDEIYFLEHTQKIITKKYKQLTEVIDELALEEYNHHLNIP